MQSDLVDFGARLRARRKELGLSATVVAESAKLSRPTVHRVEAGQPAVTMGSYLAVMHALGLRLADMAPTEQPALGDEVVLADYPQLRALAWHLPEVSRVSRDEARAIYERHWRHLEPTHLQSNEKGLLRALGLEVPGV
jgi:transcriptional regulator with XRE-family HTH domain